MELTDTTETVAGCTIRVMRKGKGAPLLFLHGAAGAGAWLPFMETFALHHDVIVPEHPGFGRSETPEWLDSIGDLAYFYLDLIKQMKLEGVHVVGTSLGGWIAAEMAIRDPDAMRTMTLVAPAGIQVKGVRRGDLFLWSPEETVKNLFHDQELAARMPVPASEEELMVSLQNRTTTARLAWKPRLHNPDLPKWLHRVSVPTLILWGDDDKLLPVAFGTAYRDLIPGAQLRIVEACGHLPHIERPETFTAATLEFIGNAA